MTEVTQPQVTEVPLEAIKIPSGRESVEERGVEELAKSIAQTGLLIHPILLDTNQTLIAGRSRLAACQRLGWARIPCRIIEVDETTQELLEIQENLIRKQLNHLERGRLLVRQKELYEKMHPESRHGGVRQSNQGEEASLQNANLVPPLVDGGDGGARRAKSFVQDVATKTGKSPTTIYRDLELAERISTDVDEIIAATPIAANRTELQRLADLPAEVQHQVAVQISRGKAKTVSQATKQLHLESHRKTVPRNVAVVKKAEAALGVVVRAFTELGMFEQFRDSLDAMSHAIKEIK